MMFAPHPTIGLIQAHPADEAIARTAPGRWFQVTTGGRLLLLPEDAEWQPDAFGAVTVDEAGTVLFKERPPKEERS